MVSALVAGGDSFLEDRTVTLSGSGRCCRVTPEWRTLVRTESELVRGKLLVGGIRRGNGGGRRLLAGPRRNQRDFVLSGQRCRTFSADLMTDCRRIPGFEWSFNQCEVWLERRALIHDEDASSSGRGNPTKNGRAVWERLEIGISEILCVVVFSFRVWLQLLRQFVRGQFRSFEWPIFPAC